MSFKNKFFARFPKQYISRKANDAREAKTIIEGYERIRSNELFDDKFYLDKYPKVKSSGMDPLLHYIFFGFDEGKKPCNDFDGVFYKNHYDDVNINPLIHYALYGIDENRLIKPQGIDLSEFNKDNGKNILFVSHEKIGTVGGTGFLNLDIIRNLDNSYNPFILTSDGEDVELWHFNHSLEKIANYNVSFNTNYSIIDNSDNIIDSNSFEKQLFSNQLAIIYNEILSKININIVHINHLINHSFDLINSLNEKSIPFLINLHDFYYICPSIHLINSNYQFCKFKCDECEGIAIDKSHQNRNIIKSWQKLCGDILGKSCFNIAPTQSVIDFYKKSYPDLSNFIIIEHGTDNNKSSFIPKFTSNPIKILVPGHISPHKGSFLLKEIKKLDKKNKLEFNFIGTTIPNLNKYGINHGRYERKNFNKLVAKINPSYSLILSTCPETYSYTLTESWMAGIPVIVSDIGALKERVSKTKCGWLVDYENPKQIYEFIININQKEYSDKVNNLKTVSFKDTAQMSNEYISLYDKILKDKHE